MCMIKYQLPVSKRRCQRLKPGRIMNLKGFYLKLKKIML